VLRKYSKEVRSNEEKCVVVIVSEAHASPSLTSQAIGELLPLKKTL
jgi:hypothetical protein